MASDLLKTKLGNCGVCSFFFLFCMCGELWKLDQVVPITSSRNTSDAYVRLLILRSCVEM